MSPHSVFRDHRGILWGDRKGLTGQSGHITSAGTSGPRTHQQDLWPLERGIDRNN